jgi:predicted helicase
MFEVIYKCMTPGRDQWYYDGEHDTFQSAVNRCVDINRQQGRAVQVLQSDVPVYYIPQSARLSGVPVPPANLALYLD